MRRRVVLPHPEGPSRKKRSPGFMFSDTLSTAVILSKRLVRFFMLIGVMAMLRISFCV